MDRDVAAYESMRTALLSLPSRQRAAIVLRYYEDLHESEIADLLRCTFVVVANLRECTNRALMVSVGGC